MGAGSGRIPWSREDVGEAHRPAAPVLRPLLTAASRWRRTPSGTVGGRSVILDVSEADASHDVERPPSVAEILASRERLVRAADADRRRIERDLHENVRQYLIALSVELQRARPLIETDPPAAMALLDDMSRDVRQALDATARLGQRVYPALLDAGGLGAALRSAVTTLGIRASIEVVVGADVSGELAVTVYLCCLEALELVGPAGPATVTVRDENGALAFEVVEVVGDGVKSARTVGRDEERLRLRDRVDAHGGRVTIGPRPDGRLAVSGWLPKRR
jgi:signal transduction histidine kinase